MRITSRGKRRLRCFSAALVLAILSAAGASAQDTGPPAPDNRAFSTPQAPENAKPSPTPLPEFPPLLSTKEPIKVEQTLDRAIITVGDPVTYTMTVEAPEGMEIGMPPPGAQLGRFIIRDYEIPEPSQSGNRVTHEFIFTITAYTTGQLEIPPVPVFINPASESPRVLITEGIQVRVAPVTNPDDLQIRDVKPPLSIPLDYSPYLIAAAAALGLIGALALILLYLYRYRPKPVEMPEPVRPAHEFAYQELRELEALRLLEAGEFEAFYTRLSEIIRRYIALRFRIYALEYTSAEILEALKSKALETRVYERIRWFLEETDLVKFARHMPRDKERAEIMGRARKIIDWTRERDLDPMADEMQDAPRREEKNEERINP